MASLFTAPSPPPTRSALRHSSLPHGHSPNSETQNVFIANHSVSARFMTKRSSVTKAQNEQIPAQTASGEEAAAATKEGVEKGSPVCEACGVGEKERGCGGDGRIQGGIATIPGFSWWPIKAYRPCPSLVKSGRVYKRLGQNMDEVAFGAGDKKK